MLTVLGAYKSVEKTEEAMSNKALAGLAACAALAMLLNPSHTKVSAGEKFQVAIFGVNGPISVAPANSIWFREAKLQFYK